VVLIRSMGRILGTRAFLSLAAALAASGLLGGCQPPIPPTATPGAPTGSGPIGTGRPSAVAPTPAPTDGSAPYATIQFEEGDIAAFSLDDELGEDLRIYEVETWGPRVVFNVANPDRARNLYLVDLVAQSLSVVATAPPSEERVWFPDISGDWVVWTEYHYENPGEEQRGPSHWRVLAKRLTGESSEEVIANGTHKRLVGLAGGAAPAVARVDGDLIAYAVEAPRPQHADAWSIVVKSLVDGSVVRRIETDRDLYRFELAGGNVVYTEGTTDETLDFKYNTRLMISTVAQPEPSEVGRHAYEVTASGDRFAWVWDEEAGELGSPRPITPVIMTATFGEPTGVQASVLTQGPPPPEGLGAPLLGGLFPGASDEVVAWHDRQTDGTWDGELRRVAMFDPRTGRSYQIEPSPNPVVVAVQGGWVVWNVDTNADGTDITHVIFGIPVEEALSRLPD
jgi:hypothetical protein